MKTPRAICAVSSVQCDALAQIGVMKIAKYLNTTEYTECQVFSPVVRIGLPPPHLQASRPTLVPGRGSKLACGRGGGVANPDEETDTLVL